MKTKQTFRVNTWYPGRLTETGGKRVVKYSDQSTSYPQPYPSWMSFDGCKYVGETCSK